VKKLLFFVFLSFFFFTSCEKDGSTKPDNPVTPPPPPPKSVEVKVKFGQLPEECLAFEPTVMGFKGEKFFTGNLVDSGYFKYPEFTYKFTTEHANKYIGKKVTFYFAACRNLTHEGCWLMEVFIDFDPLKETQEVFIEIPGLEE
jgi:hypothetical protein